MLWTFDWFPVALTTQQECIAATLSELFIAGCAGPFRALISIKDTMIIVGGYHSINLMKGERP
jgi:hypothetical protein